MIKLKQLLENLTEAKKYNMDNVEDVAEFLIRQAWNRMPPSDEKYDDYDVSLWIDSEFDLQSFKEKTIKNFFKMIKTAT